MPVAAQSPAGPIEPVANLKRRQRDLYWRPIQNSEGTVVWAKTLLLPSDAQSKENYMAKGFRLSPPGVGTVPTSPNSDTEALLAEIKRQDVEIKQLKEEQKNKVNLE